MARPYGNTAAPRSRGDHEPTAPGKDPFEAVWDEVCQLLTEQPERTGKSVFDELQQRSPGQFATNQLRTLQRHIQLWRAKTILAFDDQWTELEGIVQQSLPRPLRVAVEPDLTAEYSA
jgi:hypothetical protein